MPNNPQVPWTDEQWARVSRVVQEEAKRARVAATFLPLYGPLPPDADFVRRDVIPSDAPLRIEDRATIQLATLEVKVRVRSAQMGDPDMTSVLALFRRAANVIARLEDAVVFRGLEKIEKKENETEDKFAPPRDIVGLPDIWDIHGGQEMEGLWAEEGRVPVTVPHTDVDPTDPRQKSLGDVLVGKVSDAISEVERDCHLGPFALVLDPKYFLAAQSPAPSLVLPQDRILPFLGGGSLLRSSTLPENSGVLVALGGAPVELVVAQDLAVQFLQVTQHPHYLFRLCEKIALRIKEAGAIANLKPDEQAKPREQPTEAGQRRRQTRG
jgi:uncharacterized linocin/CFP29 family protein